MMSDFGYSMMREESVLRNCADLLGLKGNSYKSLSIIENTALEQKNNEVLFQLEMAGLIYTHGGV